MIAISRARSIVETISLECSKVAKPLAAKRVAGSIGSGGAKLSGEPDAQSRGDNSLLIKIRPPSVGRAVGRAQTIKKNPHLFPLRKPAATYCFRQCCALLQLLPAIRCRPSDFQAPSLGRDTAALGRDTAESARSQREAYAVNKTWALRAVSIVCEFFEHVVVSQVRSHSALGP